MSVTAYVHPMSTFLVEAGFAMRASGVLAGAPLAVTAANVADVFRSAAEFSSPAGSNSLHLVQHGADFRTRWTHREWRDFQAAIPASIWSIEDLRAARAWIDATLRRRGAEEGTAGFAALVRDAAYASGLALFPVHPSAQTALTHMIEGLGYETEIAERIAPVIAGRIDGFGGMERIRMERFQRVGWWLNELDDMNLARGDLEAIFTTLVERGLTDYDPAHTLWMERLLKLGVPPAEFPRLLQLLLGDTRKSGATERMRAAARALKDDALKKDLLAIEARLAP